MCAGTQFTREYADHAYFGFNREMLTMRTLVVDQGTYTASHESCTVLDLVWIQSTQRSERAWLQGVHCRDQTPPAAAPSVSARG